MPGPKVVRLDGEMPQESSHFSPQQNPGVLAPLLSGLIESYLNFLREPFPDDDKQFSARHCAGKTALSHMEQLLKLTSLTENRGFGEGGQDDPSEQLIARARSALAKYENPS